MSDKSERIGKGRALAAKLFAGAERRASAATPAGLRRLGGAVAERGVAVRGGTSRVR